MSIARCGGAAEGEGYEVYNQLTECYTVAIAVRTL